MVRLVQMQLSTLPVKASAQGLSLNASVVKFLAMIKSPITKRPDVLQSRGHKNNKSYLCR